MKITDDGKSEVKIAYLKKKNTAKEFLEREFEFVRCGGRKE